MDIFGLLIHGLAASCLGAGIGAVMKRPIKLSAFVGFCSSVFSPIFADALKIGTHSPTEKLLAATALSGLVVAVFNLLVSRVSSPLAPRSAKAPADLNWSVSDQAKAFISYRRDDSLETTGRIYDRLSREYGERKVFRDLDSMPFGIDFRDYIDKRLADCNICFVVIGPNFLSVTDSSGNRRIDDPRDHVRIEIETALKRNIRVVPLIVGGAPIPREADLPPSLASLAYRAGTNIRPDPDFHRDIDRLMSGLRAS